MLTVPDRWHPSCEAEPRLPFLALPGASVQLGDPVQVAEWLASLLPVRSCDAVGRSEGSQPFRCHLGGLRLGDLSLMALWGPGLRGEVEGSVQASFILPYRGSGQFRLEGRSLVNSAGLTLLYLPPGPWRTTNDAMGGIKIRLDPRQLRAVVRSMAGPGVAAEHWQSIGAAPRVVPAGEAASLHLVERLYRLMAFIDALLLRHGDVAEALRLDDLLLRQIATVLAPALLAEPSPPEAEPSLLAIDALVDWMHAHCHEPICLSDLERRSHYSRRSLQYIFRARFGCGPMQYLRRQRLWLARRRLEEQAGDQASASGMADLARSLGYLSLASFSRDFRSCFGVPPSGLRRRRPPLRSTAPAQRENRPASAG